MTEAKKKTVANPHFEVKVSPVQSSFVVTVPGASHFFGEDTFRFSVSADGSVELNDNYFNSKDQAIKAMQAMMEFLKKQ